MTQTHFADPLGNLILSLRLAGHFNGGSGAGSGGAGWHAIFAELLKISEGIFFFNAA